MEFLYALVVSSAFILILVSLEYIVRKCLTNSDVTRRISHVAAGFFALLMSILFEQSIFLLFSAVFILIISVSYRYRYLESIHAVARKTYGEIFLPIGIIITYLICQGNDTIFTASILIVALADASAGIISDIRRLNRPSLLGSAAFLIVSVGILLLTTTLDPAASVIVGAALTAIEKTSPLGSDNATIPIAAAILLLL